MKNRVERLIRDQDYLDFWNGLLESEAYNSVYWLDTPGRQDGYNTHKALLKAKGKEAVGVFLEHDLKRGKEPANNTAIYQFLPASEFIQLYKAGKINGRRIPIPEPLKVHRVFKKYPDLQYFIDPAATDTRKRDKWFWPFTCGIVKITFSGNDVIIMKPDINPDLGERAKKKITQQLDAIYYDERQALKGQPPPKDPLTKAGVSDRKRRQNLEARDKENLLRRARNLFKDDPASKIFLVALIKAGRYKKQADGYEVDLSGILDADEGSESLIEHTQKILKRLAGYSFVTYDKKRKSLVILI